MKQDNEIGCSLSDAVELHLREVVSLVDLNLDFVYLKYVKGVLWVGFQGVKGVWCWGLCLGCVALTKQNTFD